MVYAYAHAHAIIYFFRLDFDCGRAAQETAVYLQVGELN